MDFFEGGWGGSGIPQFTWANRPAPAAWKGKLIFVTDIACGVLLFSTGQGWIFPGGGESYVGGSNVAVTAPENTNENTLGSMTVLSGLIGANGRMRIESVWAYTGSANAKNFRHKLGASSLYYTTTSNPSNISAQFLVTMRNVNNAAAQIASSATSTSTIAVVETTENTASALTLAITGQKASAVETLTLVAWAAFVRRHYTDA